MLGAVPGVELVRGAVVRSVRLVLVLRLFGSWSSNHKLESKFLEEDQEQGSMVDVPNRNLLRIGGWFVGVSH